MVAANGNGGRWQVWFKILAGVTVAIVISLQTRTMIATTNMEREVGTLKEDVAAIKANRFTTSDGLEVWKEIARVRGEIALLPQLAPPVWFEARVDRLDAEMKARLDSMEDLLRDHLVRHSNP
jgi:hypothetical protein